MSDQNLNQIYEEILDNHFPGKKFYISAVFYKTRSLRHTIELKSGKIHIRIAESFMTAPERILYVLGIILLTKLFRYKLATDWRKEYNAYVDQFILPGHRHRINKPSEKYKSEGVYYNLDLIFDEINSQYFNGTLQKPMLGWSLNKSYTRLGFFSEEKDMIVISRIFDSKKVPESVIYFLMYHEMLHVYLPTQKINGRRRIHSREFRKMEKAFPEFEAVEKWIKRYRHRL